MKKKERWYRVEYVNILNNSTHTKRVKAVSAERAMDLTARQGVWFCGRFYPHLPVNAKYDIRENNKLSCRQREIAREIATVVAVLVVLLVTTAIGFAVLPRNATVGSILLVIVFMSIILLPIIFDIIDNFR